MLTAIKGTYSNGRIILHERPPVEEETEVVVTFLKDSGQQVLKPEKTDLVGRQGIRFGSLIGKVSIPNTFNESLGDLNEYM